MNKVDIKTVTRLGYQGIWYDLGQSNEYGSKYSGGLATYTAKHRPIAIYSAEAECTFFVYGGTRATNERYLLCMVGAYDHRQKKLLPPTVVHDKEGVDDPHDNSSIAIDEKGFLWIFVSGRGSGRPGFIYRSNVPYSIESFQVVDSSEFTYPQPWWIAGKGFFHFFTQYTGLRELYFNTSADGYEWGEVRKLAGIGGHYQLSEVRGDRLVTAFNRHPGGDCDMRTDLYYVETRDMGESWQTIDGHEVHIPICTEEHPTRIRNYQVEGKLVYVKDLNFDHKGNPIILVVTSRHCHAGPAGNPREWEIVHWNGREWKFQVVTSSSHNYDTGSIYVEGETWRLIAPTEPGPQRWGQGGEVAVWESPYPGNQWKKVCDITHESPRNHSYVRRPVNAHDDFYAFWCDGHSDTLSDAKLYYTRRPDYAPVSMPMSLDDLIE